MPEKNNEKQRSQYDDVRSAADLINRFRCHGFSMRTEDICRAQDIIGHEPIENLVELANNIGRCDANGKPDPKGTWSGGPPATRDIFYSAIFKLWHWEDATRFWNMYTNPQTEKLATAEAKLAEEIARTARICERYGQLESKLIEAEAAYNAQCDRLAAAEANVEEQEDKIVRLKARLYDMLVGDDA